MWHNKYGDIVYRAITVAELRNNIALRSAVGNEN